MRINPYGENPDVALGRVATISVDKAVNFMEETGWDLLDEVSAGLIVGAVVAKLSGMDSEVNLNPTSQQQSMSTRGDGTREGVEFQEVHAHQSPLFAGPDIHFTTLSFQVGIESLLKEGEDWNKVSYRSTDWRNIRRRSSNGQALAAENLITGMLNGGIDDGWIVNIEHVKKDRDSAQSRNRSTGGYHSKTGPHAFFSVTLFVRLISFTPSRFRMRTYITSTDDLSWIIRWVGDYVGKD